MPEHITPFFIHTNERSFQRSLSPHEVSIPFQNQQSRLKKVTTMALGVAIAAGAVASTAHENIVSNQEQAAAAISSIDIVSTAIDEQSNDSAIVFLDGFGSYNSVILAESLGPAVQQVQDGEIWSIDYGNALIDVEAIADRITETALERDVETLQLFGYSAGGNIALNLATAVQKRGFAVSTLYLASTPNGLTGLREDKQTEVDTYASVMAKIPWLAYYDPARYVGEMALKLNAVSSPSITGEDLTAIMQAHHETIDLMNYEYTPGTWLLIDQMVAIEQSDARAQLHTLAKNAQRNTPNIVYLGTDAPGYDMFVDDKKSGAEICSYAAEVDLPCFRYNVPGAIHMRPNLTIDAYDEALTKLATRLQD